MSIDSPLFPLDISSLRSRYAEGSLTPTRVVHEVFSRINERHDDAVWISIREKSEVMKDAERLQAKLDSGRSLPLFGIPFGVKDNIDVAGLPTTAACPDFAYRPGESAPAVQRLIDAGAMVIGKTNMDQFATGLVGVRSPYGTPHNPFHEDYIPGGSSSGSAVAVSAGQVSFALGTDTAGSGRVPAGFNNIVGLKPSRGFLSTRGVVPACRSLDCVSIFALTCEDAAEVLAVAGAYDEKDPFSRRSESPPPFPSSGFRFGMPRELEFFGDSEAEEGFLEGINRLEALGGTRVPIDFHVFREAAELLYQGPWIAERWAALRDFYATNADAFHPVTRRIIESGAGLDAADLFLAQYRLAALRREAEALWETMELLLVPSSPTIYLLAEIEADPITPNIRLGTYTNFANLLDLCGVAVPAGFRLDGLPTGVTLLAPRWNESCLLALGSRFHRVSATPLGATRFTLSADVNA